MKTAFEGTLRQVLLTMSASLSYLTIGLIRGWSSTAIPSMEITDPNLVASSEVVSWVCAIPPLGAFLGSLVAGPLLHNLGRRRTLQLSGPLFTFGWVLLGYTREIHFLILARICTGFCAGLVTPSAQVYVSECAYPGIRGLLGSLPALFMAIGVLVSYVLGSWLRWDHLAYTSAIFPAAMFVLLLLLPESPSWLRDHNRFEEADKASNWLNIKVKFDSDNSDVYTIPRLTTDEKTTIKSKVLPSITKHHPSLKTSKVLVKGKYTIEALTQKSVLIPFSLVAMILIFQQISGIDTIIFYTVSILSSNNSPIDDYTATIIVGIVQVVATIISIFLIDHVGRKPLLILSGLFMGLSMTALGTYFYIKEVNPQAAKDFSLTPVISLIVFMTGFSVGYCNIPFLLMGELLPLAQRSLLSSVASALNLGSMFLVIKTYENIKSIIGADGVFWLYAVFCFSSCLFVIAFLPETKKKTLEDIQEYFEMKNKNELNGPTNTKETKEANHDNVNSKEKQ